MKKQRNELVEFLVGLVLCVSGLFVLSQKVIVVSGFSSFSFYGRQINGGLMVVPLLFDYLLILVGIFGGGGLLLKVLLNDRGKNDKSGN